jgi:hypothetical protein
MAMKTNTPQPAKVSVTIHITKEAQDILFDNGYASQRTVGMFISELIVDHHARVSRQPTQAEIAQELRRLASLMEEVDQYSKQGSLENSQSYQSEEPMPLANIIDGPIGLVGVTVISEEDGCEEDNAKPL